LNKRGKVYLKLFSIALGVIFIDQLTKWFVRTNLDIRETWMPISWLEPYFRFIHWKNTGVAFGLFQGMGWILTSLGLVVILIIIFFYKPVFNGPVFWQIALGLQLGGAIGNLLDRINPNVGYVVDFIWIGNFPVFNLADFAIVSGAIVMLIGIWYTEERAEKKEGNKEGKSFETSSPIGSITDNTSRVPADPDVSKGSQITELSRDGKQP